MRRKIFLLIRNLKYWKVKRTSLEHQAGQRLGNSANSLYSSDLLIRSAAKAQATWKAPAVNLTPGGHCCVSSLDRPPSQCSPHVTFKGALHSTISITQLQYAASPLSTTSESNSLQPLYPIIKSGGLFNAISLNPITGNRIFHSPD